MADAANFSTGTDGDSVKGDLSYTQQPDKNTTETVKITGSYKPGDTGVFSMQLEDSVKQEVAERIQAAKKDTVGVEFSDSDTKLKQEAERSMRFGDDNAHTRVFVKDSSSISTKKGYESSVTAGMTQKQGIFENTMQGTVGTGFDGKKATLRSEISSSAKVGNEEFSVETSQKHSNTIGTDGSRQESTTVGGKVNAGAVEVGAQTTQSHSQSTGQDDKGQETQTEETTQNTEGTVGVKASEGVKLKQTVGTEKTEKVSENEEVQQTETTEKLNFKTRIEVDSQKATTAEVLMAAMFNMQAAVTEKALSAATETKTTNTVVKETPAQQEAESQEYDYYNGYGY